MNDEIQGLSCRCVFLHRHLCFHLNKFFFLSLNLSRVISSLFVTLLFLKEKLNYFVLQANIGIGKKKVYDNYSLLYKTDLFIVLIREITTHKSLFSC